MGSDRIQAYLFANLVRDLYMTEPVPNNVSSVWTRRAMLALGSTSALPKLAPPKPVPDYQALPLPESQAAFTYRGREIARYHFGPGQQRPFVYPVLGPAGRSLTRMGHPHAPVSHSHHNSFWVSHQDLNGEVFWSDRPTDGRILHQWISEYVDGDRSAALTAINHWIGRSGQVLLVERRGLEVVGLDRGEWMMILDLLLESPVGRTATFGKTPFGLVGVRMAKPLGVHDGNGRIRNSEGQVNEEGPNGCFWKPARWVDYSGSIADGVQEGLTLMDHPVNPGHPAVFHVRSDGWMGASLTFRGGLNIEPDHPIRVRYGLWVHRGIPGPRTIDARWQEFQSRPLRELSNRRN